MRILSTKGKASQKKGHSHIIHGRADGCSAELMNASSFTGKGLAGASESSYVKLFGFFIAGGYATDICKP